MKERMMAIFIGLVMIGSIAGFAGVQFIPEQQNTGVINRITLHQLLNSVFMAHYQITRL